MDTAVDLNGLKLQNPIITASGTFGYGLEFSPYGDLSTLGGIVVKGLSLEPRPGNPVPRIAETACGMLNAIGLQNIGARKFVRDKLPALPWRETAVIANLYGQSPEEFGELADYLSRREEIAALEVNISCPNVRRGGVQFGQNPDTAARVTSQVKEQARGKPVIVKLSPNVADIKEAAAAAESGGADIISLINTLGGMAVDIETRQPRLANVYGGLSGPAIKPVALKMTHEAAGAVSIPVIGMGGITSARDVLEFMLVGAWAIQVGTANFISPDRSFALVRETEELAASLGISSWSEWRGTLRPHPALE
ncbi:MAG: dihydroorotate dehydrogenase [Desulfonatronovibrionaceae bacterium]